MHPDAAPPRLRTGRGLRAAPALALAALGGCVLAVLIDGRDGAVQDAIAGPMLLAISALGTALAAAAGARRRSDHRTRLAWRFIAGALALATAGCAAFAVDERFPGSGDYLRLACAPVFLAGLLIFPVARRTRRDRQRLALDTGIVVSCGFVVLWYLTLGPAVVNDSLSGGVAAVAVAYPLADLVLLTGATKALLGGRDSSTRRPLMLLVLGLVLLVASDTQMAYAVVDQATSGGAPVEQGAPAEWLTLLLGFGAMAVGAADQLARAGDAPLGTAAERRLSRVTLVPYLAVAVGYGLLVVVAAGAGLYPWGGLVAGAVAMTGLVVMRQVLELQESHTLAVTDPLTGLATRPRLNDAMLRALADAERTGVSAAVLVLDMDDFKSVNDSLGHQAGDEALVQLTAAVRRSVSRSDTVGRLGGDEFAVVLPCIGDQRNAVAVARRICAAIAAPVHLQGTQSVLSASIGIAMSQPGDTLETMLHRADHAMYAAKRDRGEHWAVAVPQAADPGALRPRSPASGARPAPSLPGPSPS